MMTTIRRISLLCVAAVAVLCMSTTVQASYMSYDGVGLNAIVTAHATGHLMDGLQVEAGQLYVTFNGKAYTGYCVDTDHYTGSGPVTVHSVLTLNRGSMIDYLFETYGPQVNTADKAGALQVAIWELLDETSGSLNVNTGSFSITGNSTVASLANSELASLPSSWIPRQNDIWLESLTERQGVLVPEPATMGLLALGGLLALRRRKTKTM